MIDTEKLSSLTSTLKQTENNIKVLESMDAEHFENGNALEITVKSSVYGTINNERITTYKSAKKHITPMLEAYQAKAQEINDEITKLIKEGS